MIIFSVHVPPTPSSHLILRRYGFFLKKKLTDYGSTIYITHHVSVFFSLTSAIPVLSKWTNLYPKRVLLQLPRVFFLHACLAQRLSVAYGCGHQPWRRQSVHLAPLSSSELNHYERHAFMQVETRREGGCRTWEGTLPAPW